MQFHLFLVSVSVCYAAAFTRTLDLPRAELVFVPLDFLSAEKIDTIYPRQFLSQSNAILSIVRSYQSFCDISKVLTYIVLSQ